MFPGRLDQIIQSKEEKFECFGSHDSRFFEEYHRSRGFHHWNCLIRDFADYVDEGTEKWSEVDQKYP